MLMTLDNDVNTFRSLDLSYYELCFRIKLSLFHEAAVKSLIVMLSHLIPDTTPVAIEPRCQKNGLRGFRQGPTQIRL